MRSISLALALAIAAAPALAFAAEPAWDGFGVPLTKILSAEVPAALFDGARPGFADRHKVWLTLDAKS